MPPRNNFLAGQHDSLMTMNATFFKFVGLVHNPGFGGCINHGPIHAIGQTNQR
jgi:hypothetical protein